MHQVLGVVVKKSKNNARAQLMKRLAQELLRVNRMVEQLLEWDSIFVDPKLQFSVNRLRAARDSAMISRRFSRVKPLAKSSISDCT